MKGSGTFTLLPLLPLVVVGGLCGCALLITTEGALGNTVALFVFMYLFLFG